MLSRGKLGERQISERMASVKRVHGKVKLAPSCHEAPRQRKCILLSLPPFPMAISNGQDGRLAALRTCTVSIFLMTLKSQVFQHIHRLSPSRDNGVSIRTLPLVRIVFRMCSNETTTARVKRSVPQKLRRRQDLSDNLYT